MGETTPGGRCSVHVQALVLFGTGYLALLSCRGPVDKRPDVVRTTRLALIPLEPPTTVEAGTPALPVNTCPGGQVTDQCGSWAGVELRATRHLPRSQHQHGGECRDAHCLCRPIDFQIPAELPVTEGRSGWDWDKAELAFRNPVSGRVVECRYRGNGEPPGRHQGAPAGGDKYVFERCSDGSRPGQTKRGDWFELELGQGHAHDHSVAGATEVQLRLGEADVVAGVVREQIFYSGDPRIPGAALHVPRGAAPAFETFSLDALAGVPLGTNIPNANDPATSVSFAVDVHAESTATFTFTNVPGARCARIELPYDQATLDAVAGPGGEGTIQAHQLTSLVGVTSGAQVLASAGPVTIDLARHTFSFCVEHLSFYIGASGGFNSNLTVASIRSMGGGALPATNLLGAATLPILNPLESYELTLGFTRIGGVTAWTSPGNIYLVAVGAPTYPPPPGLPTVTALPTDPTPWGTPVSTNVFTGSPVLLPSGMATFTLDITSPASAQPLNFCLRNGTGPGGFFGDCFSWDLESAGPGGTAPVPLAEICDNIDNNGNGLVDDGLTRPCYGGPAGTQGIGVCHAGVSTCGAGVWGACVGDVLPSAESCGNSVDDDCDGAADEEGATFYLDQDNDGFGQAGTAVSTCNAPPFHVTTAGDCCDTDPDAHPGQTILFSMPTACGGFDYNCDGATTLFNNFVGAEQSGCPPGSGPTPGPTTCTGCAHDGWETEVPACGVTADFANCGFGPEPCVGSCAIFTNVWTISQTQTCR